MGGMGQGFGGFLDLRENIFFLNRNTQGLSSHHESRFFYMSKSEFVVSVIDKNRSFFCTIFFAPFFFRQLIRIGHVRLHVGNLTSSRNTAPNFGVNSLSFHKEICLQQKGERR